MVLKRFILLTVSTLPFWLGCNGNHVTSSVEIPQGNCIGKVCTTDGTPIDGASILLVPVGYSPFQSERSAGTIDSTLSNASGYFGFNVESGGKYNLLASNDNRYALYKSIPIKVGSQLELPEETLREPGSLSGLVQLESMDNHQSAVILLLGTNSYTTPTDTLGHFSVPTLAQGTYTLRILSIKSDFAVFDTSVTIKSGVVTNLPPKILPRKRIPTIDTFSIKYDSLMMDVTLSWTTNDTDIIDSFFIYCNREENIAPVFSAGNTVSTATFDYILSPTDMYVYQISVVGKDGWEGEPIIGTPFVNNSAITATLVTLPDDIRLENNFYTDNSYFYTIERQTDTTWRNVKYSDEFEIEKETISSRPKVLSNGIIGSDEKGNLYCFIRIKSNNPNTNLIDTDSALIVKMDKDFNIIRKLPISLLPAECSTYHYSIAVSSAGVLLVYTVKKYICYPGPEPADTTFVSVFDTDFNIITTRWYPDYRVIEQSTSSNDTTTAIISCHSWEKEKIFWFDASFNVMAIQEHPINTIDMSVPPNYVPSEYFKLCFNTIFFSYYTYSGTELIYSNYYKPTILYFFNKNDEVIARYPHPLPIHEGMYSVNNGDVYLFYGGSEFYKYSINALMP